MARPPVLLLLLLAAAFVAGAVGHGHGGGGGVPVACPSSLADRCAECESGRRDKKTTCVTCRFGYAKPRDACRRCSSGFERRDGACVPCDAGGVSDGGKGGCRRCRAGFVPNADFSDCVRQGPCGAGAGGSDCAVCARGTYSAGTDRSRPPCRSCGPGLTTAAIGSASAASCSVTRADAALADNVTASVDALQEKALGSCNVGRLCVGEVELFFQVLELVGFGMDVADLFDTTADKTLELQERILDKLVDVDAKLDKVQETLDVLLAAELAFIKRTDAALANLLSNQLVPALATLESSYNTLAAELAAVPPGTNVSADPALKAKAAALLGLGQASSPIDVAITEINFFIQGKASSSPLIKLLRPEAYPVVEAGLLRGLGLQSWACAFFDRSVFTFDCDRYIGGLVASLTLNFVNFVAPFERPSYNPGDATVSWCDLPLVRPGGNAPRPGLQYAPCLARPPRPFDLGIPAARAGPVTYAVGACDNIFVGPGAQAAVPHVSLYARLPGQPPNRVVKLYTGTLLFSSLPPDGPSYIATTTGNTPQRAAVTPSYGYVTFDGLAAEDAAFCVYSSGRVVRGCCLPNTGTCKAEAGTGNDANFGFCAQGCELNNIFRDFETESKQFTQVFLGPTIHTTAFWRFITANNIDRATPLLDDIKSPDVSYLYFESAWRDPTYNGSGGGAPPRYCSPPSRADGGAAPFLGAVPVNALGYGGAAVARQACGGVGSSPLFLLIKGDAPGGQLITVPAGFNFTNTDRDFAFELAPQLTPNAWAVSRAAFTAVGVPGAGPCQGESCPVAVIVRSTYERFLTLGDAARASALLTVLQQQDCLTFVLSNVRAVDVLAGSLTTGNRGYLWLRTPRQPLVDLFGAAADPARAKTTPAFVSRNASPDPKCELQVTFSPLLL